MQYRLVLSDGTSLKGWAPLKQRPVVGEVVFTTGMTGYVASLTDPSYYGQILVFTYPLIGNYGVPDARFWESGRVQVAGVVVGEACRLWHHVLGKKGLIEWLQEHEVPLIEGVDTRAVARRIRSCGALLGAIVQEGEPFEEFVDPHSEQLLRHVSSKERLLYPGPSKRIILVDCGVKESMLRQFRKLGVEILRVPYDNDYSDEPFDGVFISNGPGDPSLCTRTVEVLKKAMRRGKPIFGICLGSQLMALAAGGKTYKLPFGHRGHNQPCIHLPTGRCFLTSQNHGFAINASSLPSDWEITFSNLNDHSVEGIRHRTRPFSAVQFHPEASPGPTDTQYLIEEFVNLL